MPDTFYLHNATRSVHTRTARAQSPQHPKLVQRIAGGDLVVKRKRPLPLTREQVQQHLPEIQAGVKAGVFRLLDAERRAVDVTQFAVLEGEAVAPTLPPASPQPNFLPDDANRDPVVLRPARVSDNSLHAPEPSQYAQGALPDLLRPSLEEEVQEDDSDEGVAPVAPAGSDTPTVPETTPPPPSVAASAPSTPKAPRAQPKQRGK